MDVLHEELLDLVSDEIGVPREKLLRSSTLEELGIESLDAITVLFAVEDRYGVKVDESFLENARTLGDVLDELAKEVGPRQ